MGVAVGGDIVEKAVSRGEVVTHPGRYYGVLHSTRVVPVIFERKITGIRDFGYI